MTARATGQRPRRRRPPDRARRRAPPGGQHVLDHARRLRPHRPRGHHRSPSRPSPTWSCSTCGCPTCSAPRWSTASTERAPTQVVLFTAYPDHAAVEPALAAGARAVVLKDADRADLVDVIRRVATGEPIPGTAGGRAGEANQQLSRKLRQCALTRREYDILRRISMGETNPEIAEALGPHPQHGEDLRPERPEQARRPQPHRGPQPPGG